MSIPVDLDEVNEAMEWVSAGESAGVHAVAYIRRSDGKVFWGGENIDEEELPADVDDERAYLPAPHKSELGLDNDLPLAFVSERLPESLDEVRHFFRKRGAYARLKSLLDEAGQLDAWHRYEQAETDRRLMAWCLENGFVATRGATGER